MLKNIILIILIAAISLIITFILDLKGNVNILAFNHKIHSSISTFIILLLILFLTFYLAFSFIIKINYIRNSISNFIFNNSKRREKYLLKKEGEFVKSITSVLREINSNNIIKAKKLEKKIKSNLYSENLKKEINLQLANIPQ